MKLLFVCDGINKFIGSFEAEKIARYINFYRERNKFSGGYYLLFVNRVVEPNDIEFHGDLNPAILGEEEAQIPIALLSSIRPPNVSINFRRSLNPFEETNPSIDEIIGEIKSHLDNINSNIDTIDIIFLSEDQTPNNAFYNSILEYTSKWGKVTVTVRNLEQALEIADQVVEN